MAPPFPPLFILPLPKDPNNTTPSTTKSSGNNGSFILTQPAPKVYLLTFTSPPDNRLTAAFNATFHLALDILALRFPPGVLITTSSITKFYSNGLDYENAIKTPSFFPDSLFPLWRRLITYPMPTIALLNGHAFAGGLMMAMFHDYRFMNPHKGFLCLNELDFGAELRPPMASVFRVKLDMTTFRNMVLESRRYPALEAVKSGIVDGVASGLEDVLKFVEEMKLVTKGQSKSYGRIKEELYREAVRDLDGYVGFVEGEGQTQTAKRERDNKARGRVEEWELVSGMKKAKL